MDEPKKVIGKTEILSKEVNYFICFDSSLVNPNPPISEDEKLPEKNDNSKYTEAAAASPLK
jgi:hypothetical protein